MWNYIVKLKSFISDTLTPGISNLQGLDVAQTTQREFLLSWHETEDVMSTEHSFSSLFLLDGDLY